MRTIFKIIIEFVTKLLLFYVLVFQSHRACGILAPLPEIRPTPLHWKAKSQPLDSQEILLCIFPGGSVSKESTCNPHAIAADCLQRRRPRFDAWAGTIPWRKE